MHIFILVNIHFSFKNKMQHICYSVPYFSSCLLVSSHHFFLKFKSDPRDFTSASSCFGVAQRSKHLRCLWTRNQLGHLNFHLRREMWKKVAAEWSVMDCCRQPHHMCSLDCSWPEEAGTTSKVCNLASKEKHLGALLFKGRIKVLFEVHRHRFQAGNYWPSVLISKHDSLPCQPRTKLCHSCDNPSCSLSASTNKWLIYHCNYLQ